MFKSPSFLSRFKSIGSKIEVYEHALILKPEVISLDNKIRIDDFCRIEGGEGVEIFEGVHICSFSSILGGGSAYIGKYCGIAQGARIITGSGHPFYEDYDLPSGDPYTRQRKHTVIGDYSLIAVNSVVLMGVTIGEGAVVSAGSVVREDVPPWTIVHGNPAKIIGKRPKLKAQNGK